MSEYDEPMTEEEWVQLLIEVDEQERVLYDVILGGAFNNFRYENYEPMPDPPKKSITSLMWWRR